MTYKGEPPDFRMLMTFLAFAVSFLIIGAFIGVFAAWLITG